MLETLGSFAQSVGAAFILSDLGAAELIVSLLMAAGLVATAARGPVRDGHSQSSRAHVADRREHA